MTFVAAAFLAMLLRHDAAYVMPLFMPLMRCFRS